MTLTSDPLKDLSVVKTENNECHPKEPSPTGGAEQSVSPDVAEESVIRPYLGHIVDCFCILPSEAHTTVEPNCLPGNLNKRLIYWTLNLLVPSGQARDLSTSGFTELLF